MTAYVTRREELDTPPSYSGSIGRYPGVRAGQARIPVCGCGQDLDRSVGVFCPRCGVRLAVTARHVSAA